MIGRMTEVYSFTGVPAGRGKSVMNGTGLLHLVEKRLCHIYEIYTTSGKGTLLILTGVPFFNHINIRGVSANIIVQKEGLVILRTPQMPVVHTGYGIEIAQHDPVALAFGVLFQNSLLADIFHLRCTEDISAVLCSTRLLILREICVFERIGVKSDDIDYLPVDVHLYLTGTVNHYDVITIAIDPFDNLQGIL